MLVGGAEMGTTPVGLGGFAAARALSTRNDDPHPLRAHGIKIEMASSWATEPASYFGIVRKRTKPRGTFAELVGFAGGDAYHMTSPPEDGQAAQAMKIQRTTRSLMEVKCITSTLTERRHSRAMWRKQSPLKAFFRRTPTI